MDSLLFIAPHLSTGGLPQFLLKKIELLANDVAKIYLIEYSDITGGKFIVQRSKLVEILGDRMFTLQEDKSSIHDIIASINPDVIHMEEIPEFFMEDEIADVIYDTSRRYKIIETSHDSSFGPKSKKYLPDKFLFVSEYQRKQYLPLGIPSEVVEYPIEYPTQILSRDQACLTLGLDPIHKHVLHVGLFTPRKNQKEFFEYATALPDYKFHSVGNQAENFEDYWKPLMQSKPNNLTVWGERADVDIFYMACDLFLFTSQGHPGDMETMPLVIRESISWDIPTLIYDLPVYESYFDAYSNIDYLKNSKDENLIAINKKLFPRLDTKNNQKKNIKMNKNPNFSVSFEQNENKLNFNYDGNDQPDFLVSVKDIDSKAVIWSYNKKSPYSWCIPTPHHLYPFLEEPDFGGFKIDIYDPKTQDVIYEEEIRIKFPTIYKPAVEFTKTEPTHMNYDEFFVQKIFDDLSIENCATVLDIGANVGIWTSWILTKNAHHVYAIEPNKTALNDLKRNFATNSKVTVVEKAIFNENTTLTLNFNDANSLVSSLDKHEIRNTGIPLSKSYQVEAITVEQLVDDFKIKRIDLFKIDIEGIEFTIFESLSNRIFEITDKFLIETHHFYYDDGHQKVKDLKIKMIDNGFNVKHFATHMLFCEKIK